MTSLLGILLILVLSYLIGGIPFGFIIGKINHIDIRQHGSKNIGATNVRRVLGRDWGILCFVCDFLKGLLPVLIIGTRLAPHWGVSSGWGEILAAVGAVSGHIFPYALHFRGGKGVSTTLGAILGIAFWPVLAGAIVWYIVFQWSKIVSLASMAAAVMMPLTALVMCIFHWGGMQFPAVLLMAALGALVIIRHKENIVRLRNGTENKFVKVKTE